MLGIFFSLSGISLAEGVEDLKPFLFLAGRPHSEEIESSDASKNHENLEPFHFYSPRRSVSTSMPESTISSSQSKHMGAPFDDAASGPTPTASALHVSQQNVKETPASEIDFQFAICVSLFLNLLYQIEPEK